MRREAEGVYTGDLAACPGDHQLNHPIGTALGRVCVVHACKYPCHVAKCGKVRKDSPNYLSLAEEYALWLNMIDPEAPLFQLETFKVFFDWAGPRWRAGKTILIHCNQGESRSRSLAMLLMLQHGLLGAEPWPQFPTHTDAAQAFGDVTGRPLLAGAGITTFLSQHWEELLT